ncbi:MAG: DUF4091 domain-containing protein [Clostridia bacterium]|nr:DUF4091 domain-containing protein [Clostridia bacterium]
MKKMRRWLATLLALMTLGSVATSAVSCEDDEVRESSSSALESSSVESSIDSSESSSTLESSEESSETPAEPTTAVWTATGAEKFLREYNYSQYYGNTTLKISAVRNEKEGGQIVISAEEDGEYAIALNDLTNASGDVLKKESFNVYHGKFITVDTIWDKGAPTGAGDYTDALIPYANALEYGENKVKAGDNQSVWIELIADKTQAAGTYTGSFNVTFASKSYDVPVEIKIYDYTLSDTAYAKSCFEGLYCEIPYAELDGSLEMAQTYYDFFLDHRATINSVPTTQQLLHSYHLGQADDYLDKVVASHNNPRCTLYELPVFATGSSVGTTLNVQEYKQWLMEVAIRSLEVKQNLFEKAYTYMTWCDEYERQENGGAKVYYSYTAANQADEEVGDWILSGETSTLGDVERTFAKPEDMSQEEFQSLQILISDGVRNVRHLLTGTSFKVLDDYCAKNGLTPPAVCFVPTIDKFSNEQATEELIAYAEKNGGEVWCYSTVNPIHPWPTYHIEDAMIGSKLMAWMMYDYDIVGQLYWRFTQYSFAGYADVIRDDEHYQVQEYYGEPLRFPFMNGDGMLCYPGREYGVYGPVASIRLKGICDGNEEYDMLYALKEMYNARGVDDDGFDSFFAYLVENLYYKGKTIINYYNDTVAEFYASRKLLLSALELGESAGVIVESIDKNGHTATVRISAPEGREVNVNGTLLMDGVSKNGAVLYSVKIALSGVSNPLNIATTVDGKAYGLSMDLGEDSKTLTVAELSDKLVAHFKSTTATVTTDTVEGVELIKAEMTDTKGAPSIRFDVKDFELSTNYASVTFKVYNYGEATSVLLRGKGKKANTYIEMSTVELQAGWNEIEIPVYLLNLGENGVLDAIRFDVNGNATLGFGEWTLED